MRRATPWTAILCAAALALLGGCVKAPPAPPVETAAATNAHETVPAAQPAAVPVENVPATGTVAAPETTPEAPTSAAPNSAAPEPAGGQSPRKPAQPRTPEAAAPRVARAAAAAGHQQAPRESGVSLKTMRTPSGVEMVLIPAGSFRMGATGHNEDEAPVHTVKVDAFWMDRTAVTQEQFARMELPDPSHFKSPKNPVEQINWPQAVVFCNRRSEADGLQPCYNEETSECNFAASGYRLPTEAEWEYTCRAGTTTPYWFGSDPRRLGEYAWFSDNSSQRTHPVAQRKPNPWGLYDMYGNVAEWCNDAYDKTYYRTSPVSNPRGPAKGKLYVLRGGAWTWRADQIRSSARMPDNPGFADACLARDAIGFRCVRKASG